MMNEAEIIAEIKRGVDRYGELVERYHVGLIIHCEHLVGDRDDAEDIAQEAFVKAYSRLKDFNPERAHFSTWLYKIATNLALDHLRTRRRRVHAVDIELLADAEQPGYLEEEQKQAVRDTVGNLTPPEYRKVIEDYYWHGKTYQQIADELHVPINTVRTWIRRAKVKLKEALA